MWNGRLSKAWMCLSVLACMHLSGVASLLAQEPYIGPRLNSTGDAATDILARTQFFRGGLRTVTAEYERQAFAIKTWQTGLSLIPPLTWLRQAEAISKRPNHWNSSPGATTLDNVHYMWAIPLEELEREYKDVMSNASLNWSDKLRFSEALLSYGSNDESRDNLLLICWLGVVFSVVFWFSRTIHSRKLFFQLPKRVDVVVTWARANHILMGTVATAVLLVGFLLADGYDSRIGILGSLPFMSISLGVVEMPYRPVAITAILVVLWAVFLVLKPVLKRRAAG